jgi:hypothetical protein
MRPNTVLLVLTLASTVALAGHDPRHDTRNEDIGRHNDTGLIVSLDTSSGSLKGFVLRTPTGDKSIAILEGSNVPAGLRADDAVRVDYHVDPSGVLVAENIRRAPKPRKGR